MDGASEPSYVHGASPVALLGETIGQNLDRTAARVPDNDALVSVHQGVRMTYAQFHAAVEEVARGLLAIGVEPGERVGIWSPNNAEWVTLQYATAKAGAILVNVNPAYRTSELAYALGQSGVSTLVLAPRFRQADYLDMLDQVAGDLPALGRRVVLGPEVPAGAMGWDELRDAAGRVPVERLAEREALLQFDDPINIQYTSGTTGFPKGATLSHHNILNNGFFVGEGCGYTEADRVCIPVPLYHCFGMVLGNLACTTHGAAMVYPAEGFEPEATLAAVQAERCTSLYGVPTMFIAELEHPRFADFDLTSLRTGIMAGSPCPVEVMKKVQADMHMDEVTICYGMTETSPVSFQTGTDDPVDKRVATVGRVHPHVEVKVVDPDSGRVVPSGTTGELCTRGYVVMLGYWEDPEATAAAIDQARLDAHRRPGHPGRRRLRQHRRPHQGHGHPRRREHLPTRGRGVPLPAPGRRPTSRWWACPTPATARSCAPGCGCGRARRPPARSCATGAGAGSPPSRSPATGGSWRSSR